MSARPPIFDLKPADRRVQSHDRHGNVLTATDPKNQTTVLTWTYGHQLATRTVRNADGSVYKTETFTRNPLGQPTQIVQTNPALTQTFGYDPAHRLVSETDSRTGMSTAKTLAYDWSPGGLLNMVEDSDGHRTDYLYDGTGRLIGIWAPNFDYLAFSHDAGGRLVEKWFPNGTTARYAYNADDSLQELENRTASNALLTSHQYQYDSLGRRYRHAETIGSLGTKYLQYGFDALSRMTQVQNCTSSAYSTCTTDEALTYDIWDNRKTRTAAGATLAYVYDLAHQLKETRNGSDTGALIASYGYDANGNQTSRPGQSLVWNPDNQLTGIGNETYAYDPQGPGSAKPSQASPRTTSTRAPTSPPNTPTGPVRRPSIPTAPTGTTR